MPVTFVQRTLGIALVLFVLTPVRASAEWFLTPFFGIKFGGQTSLVDLEQASGQTTLTLGVSVSRLGSGILGAVVETAYIPGYFERKSINQPTVVSSYVFDLSGNVILALPADMTGGGLRPYFTAGLGLAHAQSVNNLSTILRVRRTVPAITLGTGATGLLTNRVGVRFDLKYLRSISEQDEFVIGVGRQLSYWRGTIGIGIRY